MTATRARRPRHMLLGGALVVYGVAGILILTVVATGLLRGLDRIEALSASVEQQRRTLTASLQTASDTIRITATTVSGVDASLGQAKIAVTDAGTLASDVSLTMANLATALNVNILGSQPFASTSAGFSQASIELQTLSTELGTTAAALGTNATDTQSIARDLLQLQVAVDAVHAGLLATPDTSVSDASLGSLRLVLIVLLAWLAVQAVAAVLLGLRLTIRRR